RADEGALHARDPGEVLLVPGLSQRDLADRRVGEDPAHRDVPRARLTVAQPVGSSRDGEAEVVAGGARELRRRGRLGDRALRTEPLELELELLEDPLLPRLCFELLREGEEV